MYLDQELLQQQLLEQDHLLQNRVHLLLNQEPQQDPQLQVALHQFLALKQDQV